MSWRNRSNDAADFESTGTGPLTREMSSQSDVYTNQFDMSPEAIAARAAAANEQSRIASEVAARLPDQASRVANDNDDLQFKLDLGGGKKRTKKRTVRRKRTYKKSKRSSYKKSKRSYKSKRSVKRGGATAPITFNIVKGNGLNPLFEVELNPNETGKDLYDRVNQWLEQNPDYLTDDERAGERKLVTDNDTPVNYADILSSFQSPTTIILSINPRQNAHDDAALAARLRELQDDN